MAQYGVTDKGFVIKRLDTIMEEIHTGLTEKFGFDTRLTKPSFLDTLVTTFSYQISELWETAQNDYYSKYPATATGVNLDNSVQYGGIRRAKNKQTTYPLHCTGDDGTYVRENAIVATNTNPEIRLQNAEEFEITRESFNKVSIKVSSIEIGVYSVTINGNQYSYLNSDGAEDSIITGIASAITDDGYVLVAGESVSGVYPAKAVNGVFIGESTEVGKTFTNTTTVLPLSGVITSGGGEMMKPVKVPFADDINVGNNTVFGTSDVPASGTIISGENTEPVVMAAVSDDVGIGSGVTISVAKPNRCGTKGCGK